MLGPSLRRTLAERYSVRLLAMYVGEKGWEAKENPREVGVDLRRGGAEAKPKRMTRIEGAVFGRNINYDTD